MEKSKKKHIGSNILIIMLIVIIFTSIGIGLYSWAKYSQTIEGKTTGEIAKWSFKVDGNTTTEDIDFAMTRTDNNSSVVTGKLAPGTYGEFNVQLDARGTETMVEYSIVVAMTNKPKNLIFYSDSEKTKIIPVNKEDKFLVRGYMDLNEVNEVRTEKIYWDWKFETGSTVSEKDINNDVDTKDSGKTMTMDITVTGVEALEKHTYLSDVVQVGDYVNYEANSNGLYTYTSNDCLEGTNISATISSTDVFSSDVNAQWRVLSIDNVAGTVDLMSVEPTSQKVTLSGIDGYANAEIILNNVGEVFGHGKGATKGRCINIEDVEQYSVFDKTTHVDNGYKYGDSKSYTLKTPGNSSVKLVGSEVKKLTGSEDNPAIVTHTDYRYNANNYFSNKTMLNLIFRKESDIDMKKVTYWLASRMVHLNNTQCTFRMQLIGNDMLGQYGLYLSASGIENSTSYSICPVVELQTKLETTGQDSNGVWQLDI